METTRSTPLRPAIWMTGVLAWASVVGLFLRIPTWAGIVMVSLTSLSFLFYLGCYVYLLQNDRESLRQERVKDVLEEHGVLPGEIAATTIDPSAAQRDRSGRRL